MGENARDPNVKFMANPLMMTHRGTLWRLHPADGDTKRENEKANINKSGWYRD